MRWPHIIGIIKKTQHCDVFVCKGKERDDYFWELVDVTHAPSESIHLPS